MNRSAIEQARRALDTRFGGLRPVADFRPPVRGWIKAIRDALGMSSAQLAKRLQIKQPTLIALEQSELKGTVQIKTLRRVAEAMDCTLVYALIPNESLDEIVRKQTRRVVERRLQSVEHSMRLEDQAVSPKDFDASLDALTRDLNPRDLWDET